MPPKPSAKGAKKAAKTQKAARTGDKKRRHRRKESYSVYIYRVLKQVRLFQPFPGVSKINQSIVISGAPRHWCLLEGHVHHELVRERRLRAHRRRGLSSGSLQQALHDLVPRNPGKSSLLKYH